MISLKGKNALLVGAKRIGERVGIRLAQEGVNLAIVYRTSKREAQQLQSQAKKLVKTFLLQADITREADVKKIIKESTHTLGSLDFVVNLASVFNKTPFADLDEKAWERDLKDAKGSFLLTLHAAHQMVKNPGKTRGHIILFSDSAAVSGRSYPNYLPYLTSKAAIDYMTRAFAKELASKGILVNAIAPGPTLPPPFLTADYWQKQVIDKTPLKRQSSSDEIAEMIVTFLKSETITGETIRIDSGSHLV